MTSFAGLKFLIVDDDKEIRSTLKEQLELYDAICEEAEDGLVGFNKIKNNEYDFVLSDIRMPNASGLELLNMIRDYSGKAPKVIMMSAFTDLSAQGAQNLGAVGLYLKPENIESLFELIQGNF